VFSNKPADVLAIKLGLILSELVRLLEIDSPKVLMGVIAEMGLRHVEYGLQKHHLRPFRDVMVDTLKRATAQKGHRWKTETTKSWNWAIDEIAGLIMEAVSKGRPMVDSLQR
jgi:hemoglobin-like flavoprotein